MHINLYIHNRKNRKEFKKKKETSTVFVLIGQPVKILVMVGSLNGLILPIALGVMLVAAYKKKIVGDYKQPLWLTIFGVVIVIGMAIMGGYSLVNGLSQLF